MDNIFEGTKEKGKTITIRIDRDIANKLEKLNKGSYNQALKHLLNTNEKNVIDQLKNLNDELFKIQEAFERLIRMNPQLRV
jgi:ATP sulfurylase